MRNVLSACFAVALLWAASGPAGAAAQAEVDQATAAGKAVFVVVTQAGAAGTDRALAVARKAQEQAPATAVVLLDRSRPDNADLVRRYRVASIPVPTTLVVASNGVVAAGVTLQAATPEALVKAIPSPKKAEVLLALSRKMAVFVVASRKDLADRSTVFEACSQAVRKMDGKSTTVVVEMDDEAEKAYLAELGQAPESKTSSTAVFSAAGQKTDVYRRPPTADELVKSATKKAPCCPGGSC